MTADRRKARDLRLLDQIDSLEREPFAQDVWRVAREGRDPLLGAPSDSRWCDGTFDVVYTSLEKDGAIAEVFALLSLQPIFPSKLSFFVHRLRVVARQALTFVHLPELAGFGVDISRYQERDYSTTQPIAEVAYFLGYDAIIAPSARWNCLNAVLFTSRIAPADIEIVDREADPIDWKAWRKSERKRGKRQKAVNGTLPLPNAYCLLAIRNGLLRLDHRLQPIRQAEVAPLYSDPGE